ncbi:ribosome-associated translation inhibitor RaiA [bacterium]|nr:ribosome-associated translation inhibitor RaiA [bacterium]NBW98455.1 ribosome-associated translation inhibitor RaiA [bacterium]NBX82248.1 ribosome-associated translation inhibitor RaiA [bacterium]
MGLHIKFKNIEPTDAIKAYLEKKVSKFDKYISYPMEVHAILNVSRGEHVVEITCHAEYHDMVATAKSEDLYASIDLAVTKIETQMKKEREKKKGHSAAHKVSRKGEKLGQDLAPDLPHQGKARARS